jgi:exodeoxyribonuclease V alpha subunit
MGAQAGMPWAQTAGDPDVVTVRGKVTAQVYENADTSYRVLRVETEQGKAEVWVGTMPPVHTGMAIAGVGRYEPDPRRPGEERFGIISVQPEVPRTAEGIREYLGSGAFPGIGPGLADRIVSLFGERTVDVLDREPHLLLDVPGIGPKTHSRFLEAWVENRRVSEIMIFLVGHGASGALAQRIYDHYGARAIEQIQKNPFKLARDVAGIGFKTADKIARACGLALDSPDRDAAGVLEVLSRAEEDGHTFLAMADAVEHAQKLLETDDFSRSEAAVLAAIEQLHADRLVFRDKIPACGEILLRAELALVERAIARRIGELLAVPAALPDLGPNVSPPVPLPDLVDDAIRTFEQQASFELAPAQREAVALAARSKLMILTGGPGVGKTTIVKTILWLFRQARIHVRLCAPTGRAAQRMRETTGGDAMTIHRMLGRDMENRKEFFYRADRPLSCEAIVIDECSMIDVSLMRSLLEALPDRARVIFVGDVDQLPSVGPGAVLRDLIVSGVVPTVRLTTIFRQAEGSLIITNAHRINAGEMPETASFPGGEFHLIERQGEEDAAKTVLRVVTERIPDRFGFDPLADVQVLVPMHKGAAGTILLNQALQQALNPPGSTEIVHGGGEHGPTVYRLGDKVMQTVNDANQDVYNGDIGFIVEVCPDDPDRAVIARFEDREAVYPRNKLRQLKHAYATTIHKMQGGEAMAVVVVMLQRHFIMLSRKLLYTAVTRGKRLVVLVADPRALRTALGEMKREERRTTLAYRIARETVTHKTGEPA